MGTPMIPVADPSLERKQLKAKIPTHQVLTLHRLKLMTGRPISEIVEHALAKYFAHGEVGDGVRG